MQGEHALSNGLALTANVLDPLRLGGCGIAQMDMNAARRDQILVANAMNGRAKDVDKYLFFASLTLDSWILTQGNERQNRS